MTAVSIAVAILVRTLTNLASATRPHFSSFERSNAAAQLSNAAAQLSYAAAQLTNAAAQLTNADAQLSYAAAQLSYAAAQLSYAAAQLSYAAAQLSYAAGRVRYFRRYYETVPCAGRVLPKWERGYTAMDSSVMDVAPERLLMS
jgi:DNA repair ATPase RecN